MGETRARVLIADDQPDVLEALRLLLKGEGLEAETVTSPAALIAAVEERSFEVVLMDLNYTKDTTSGREGLDLLTRIARIDSSLPVVVMTAWGSVDGAVEAMKRGARDFIQKPWENSRLLAILSTQIELGRAWRRSRRLEEENRHLRGRDAPRLVAESPAMRPVLDLLERIGPSDASVLITGEHGTGKEVIARELHARSTRASRPLVTVNAGGLSEGVLESELFGHVKGAFTDARSDRVGCFEMADGGTLLLDEIANMPANGQAKLLRVLETGEIHRVGSSRTCHVDVRVLAATNADLRREVREGRLREDLLYRLNTVEISLPPLRERKEDIPLLAEQFLRELGRRYRKDGIGFGPEAREALLEHVWPGNVRELKHVVERAILVASGSLIQPADLGLRPALEGPPVLEALTLEEAERHLIQKALDRFRGDPGKAATALGLSRSAFYRRLQHHGLGGGER
jgi:DNA-binding NtrC family response regulator